MITLWVASYDFKKKLPIVVCFLIFLLYNKQKAGERCG